MSTPVRTVRVPDELWAAAKAEADRRGESVTDAIVRSLTRYTTPRATAARKTGRKTR